MLLIKAPRDALLRPLQIVSGIVERRHTLPILSNVLLEKAGDGLTFLATDIEIQISTSATVHCGEASALTVQARKFQDILRALPAEVEVELIAQEKRLIIKAARSRFSLQTLPAEDFPRLAPVSQPQCRLNISRKRLRHALSLVQCAMAQQDVRYYLNGLLVVLDAGILRLVATDGHRLAYVAVDVALDVPRQEVIVPRKTILELVRLLDDSDEDVEIEVSGSQIKFVFSNTTLVSKLVDGKFPDYERVIPAVHDRALPFSRQLLAQTLQRAAILTNEKFRGVRCVLADNCLRIVSTNAEQEEAQEEIEVEYSGPALDIGFNVTYLLDALNTLDDDEIVWHFGDSNSSSLITVKDNPHYKYVVMPMRI